ncbi:MAG: queuosine salvage family protein, partial [Candidatus Bipolaricaulota bacterium]|nr:queuosine salvage family protein [Candidatus Bipolaricaulota bacterium]
MENPVREGARWIGRHARWAWVDRAGAEGLAERIRDAPVPPWEGRYHFRGEDELTLRYLLALDALNFCFWPPDPRTGEKWGVPGPDGETLTGYFALAWALRRAAEEEPSFFAPEALATVDSDRVTEVLGGIPLLPWRVRALREVGGALLRWGSAEAFFAAAGGSCRRLVELVTAELPLFRDAALYRGREVLFHKRAQILCADLWG